MGDNFNSSEEAGKIAENIYQLSTECLMAHSIRGVEKFLREKYNFNTKIVLEAHPNVLADMGRMSYCSVADNSGDTTFIFVQADHEGTLNQKRFCIAHELYHVIWSVGSSSKSPRTKMAESVCDVFANDLCKKHDSFYRKEENIGKLRFDGLPYRSV